MTKTIYSREYKAFLKTLREARTSAGLTQEELAKRLRQTQSFVSKCERGERRVDVVELRHFCRALNLSFSTFMMRLEENTTRKRDD
jgi:transcriptional regulator with XRE-family HTH domain